MSTVKKEDENDCEKYNFEVKITDDDFLEWNCLIQECAKLVNNALVNYGTFPQLDRYIDVESLEAFRNSPIFDLNWLGFTDAKIFFRIALHSFVKFVKIKWQSHLRYIIVNNKGEASSVHFDNAEASYYFKLEALANLYAYVYLYDVPQFEFLEEAKTDTHTFDLMVAEFKKKGKPVMATVIEQIRILPIKEMEDNEFVKMLRNNPLPPLRNPNLYL